MYWWLELAPSAACSGQKRSHRATIGNEASRAFCPAEISDGMWAYLPIYHPAVSTRANATDSGNKTQQRTAC